MAEREPYECHKCPEKFDSLRELNAHQFDYVTLKEKDCPKPYPTPRWYVERNAQLQAEIEDLRARIQFAKKHRTRNPWNGPLNLRRKNWRAAT